MRLKTQDYLAIQFLAKEDLGHIRDRFRSFMLADLGADVESGRDLLDPGLLAHMQVERRYFVDAILHDAPYKHYLLSATAQEIAATVNVGESFNFGLLSALRPQHSVYILGPKEFIRFYVEPHRLLLMHLHADPHPMGEMVYFDTFTVDFQHGVLGWREMKEKQNAIARRLLQLVIFVERSEPELLVLPPGRKPTGMQLAKGDTFRNETPVAITRVHSHWNKFVVRTEGFAVQGHLRLQACGPRHTERKLTWVSAHERKGYVRAPKH